MAINEALVDEKLAGKRLQVKGAIVRVMRNDRFEDDEAGSYLVVMDPWNLPPFAITTSLLPKIYFLFKQSSRRELAPLKAGQMVTIEAKCGDNRLLDISRVILFHNCKILAVE